MAHQLKRRRGGVTPNPIPAVLHGNTVSINGVTFTAQSVATYGIRRDAANDCTYFERGIGVTRAELVAPHMTIGATQRWTWDIIYDALDDGMWDATPQVHGIGDVRSAIFAVFPEAGRMIARHRSSDEAGVVQPSVDVDMGAIVIGQRYSGDLTIRQHATDGKCIFNFGLYGQTLSSIFNITTGRFGFPDEEAGQPADNGPYFKHGIYGDTAATTAMRARYLNVTLH